MPEPSLLARSRDLARIALASAVALVVLVLLFPFVVDYTTFSDLALVFWGVLLLLAAIILGVSLAYVFMTRGMRTEGAAPTPARPPNDRVPVGPSEPAAGTAEDLPLRLLTADERQLYRKVVEAGGVALQKDLVRAGPFSGPKVTRILDRLERKGILERERHGMTNRIRLSDAWRGKA